MAAALFLLLSTLALPAVSRPLHGRLVYVDADGRLVLWAEGKSRALTTARRATALPVWSPDGDRIAYVELLTPGSRSPFRVTVMPVAPGAKGPRELAPTSDDFLLWREITSLYWPTQDRLAVEGRIDPDTVVLALLDLRSGRLLDTRPGKFFFWSPDGSQLADIGWVPHFGTAGSQDRDRVEIDGKEVFPTDLAGRVKVPPPLLWSRHGESLAFLAEREGRLRLVIARKGQSGRELGAELGDAARLLAWSDDDRSLLVEAKGTLLRVSIASGGAEAQPKSGLEEGFRVYLEEVSRKETARGLGAEEGSWWPPVAEKSQPSGGNTSP